LHEENRTGGVAEQLSTLALSVVAPARPLSGLTAAGWANRLLRLGVGLPLFVVHDLGWILSAPPAERQRRPPSVTPNSEAFALLASYQALLDQLGDSPNAAATAGLRLREELVAVLLARLLSRLARRWPGPKVVLPLDPELYRAAAHPVMADEVKRFLRLLTSPKETLHLLTAVELLDVNMLRLLSTAPPGGGSREAAAYPLQSGEGTGAADLIDLVDLLRAVDAPEVRDVVRFSLDLLPSVLETRRSAGSQQYPLGGYAALERRGPLDALLLGELCVDEELFLHRLSENELLYHGRERRHDEGRGEQHILIDASPSMHGLRQVFARGLAMALAQKLLLLGAVVKLRFFDGRLHEAVAPQPSLAAALPYLLSFRSSRGRHYGRVFQELLRELQSQEAPGATGASRRGAGPGPGFVQAVHILTHGECHIPGSTVQALARLTRLHGVFVLPSGTLALDYLRLLHSSAVITDEDLRQPEARRARALGIVEEVERADVFPRKL
jgi:hypothetical protein